MASSLFLVLSIITVCLLTTTARIKLDKPPSLQEQQPEPHNSTSSSPLYFTVHPLRPLASILNFTNTKFTPNDLSAPLISEYASYYVKVGWGTPAQAYNRMIIDTGSPLNWIQCDLCPVVRCHEQDGPLFHRDDSETYNESHCNNDSDCPNAPFVFCDDTCRYEVVYVDKSFSIGHIATETVTFSGSKTIPNIVMGCSFNSKGNFGKAAGILGLSAGELSFPTQIKATSFSYCLVDDDRHNAFSTLDFNVVPPRNSMTVPLKRVGTHYFIELIKITVDDIHVHSPFVSVDESGKGGQL